jgi:hypothetical protein
MNSRFPLGLRHSVPAKTAWVGAGGRRQDPKLLKRGKSRVFQERERGTGLGVLPHCATCGPCRFAFSAEQCQDPDSESDCNKLQKSGLDSKIGTHGPQRAAPTWTRARPLRIQYNRVRIRMWTLIAKSFINHVSNLVHSCAASFEWQALNSMCFATALRMHSSGSLKIPSLRWKL